MSNFELPNLSTPPTPQPQSAAQPAACPANPEPVSAFDDAIEPPKPQAEPKTDILSPNAGDVDILTTLSEEVEKSTTKFDEILDGQEYKGYGKFYPDKTDGIDGIKKAINDTVPESMILNAKKEATLNKITNEDGSVNFEKIGELFQSGSLDFHDIANALDITLNLSNTGNTTLQDGTKISFSDQRWSGMTDSQSIKITTPDGQEYSFEYKPQ